MVILEMKPLKINLYYKSKTGFTIKVLLESNICLVFEFELNDYCSTVLKRYHWKSQESTLAPYILLGLLRGSLLQKYIWFGLPWYLVSFEWKDTFLAGRTGKLIQTLYLECGRIRKRNRLSSFLETESIGHLGFVGDSSNETMVIIFLLLEHGLSQYLETGCPNRGFIDFCVSKVWYKVHTTNKIKPIYLQILLFWASNCFVCLIKVTIQLLHLLSSKKCHHQQILT